mmetsp:Transcript_30157/g.115672  ORF Transcript_30157/g.115672 Transcript_30157/m.115672 type:complete len:282 (+) Transcript_30157:149-994(+)
MNGKDRKLRIGGVPEHFNVPWGMDGIDVQFSEVREGSGAMLKGLAEGTYDGIVALTECVVAKAYEDQQRSEIKIIGKYVASELVWGVHVGGKSEIESVEQLRGKRFGISRMGSGSHVMAAVMAEDRGWSEGLEFVVVGGFSQLRDAVNSGVCDVFMWEKFMTKPFHDSGEVRTIGEVPTPWPCFVLACKKDNPAQDQMKEALQKALQCAKSFKLNEDEKSVSFIVKTYGLAREDASQWLEAVRYADPLSIAIEEEHLLSAFTALKSAGVIAKSSEFDDRLG